MASWSLDSIKYGGGGNFSDAIRLLADASEKPPGSLLRRQFTVPTAREALLLPAGLRSQFTVPI
jgi:hypothetical protein